MTILALFLKDTVFPSCLQFSNKMCNSPGSNYQSMICYKLIYCNLLTNVGQERKGNIVGPCGMGEKNERGEKLIEFCQSRKLTITNTWFTQPNRRKYTWISPDGKTRNQIDYIMINTRFRNSVKQTKTYTGADIGSDHNPVVATVKINLKRIKKKENMEQFNLDMLKDEHMRQQYAVEVNNIFDCLEHEVTTSIWKG